MFWKHAIWSWHNADGEDRCGDCADWRDCDAAYLLTAELGATAASDSAAVLAEAKRFSDSPAATRRLSGPAETKRAGLDAERDAERQLTVSVVRGQDGFGFTICCDSPVRVQSVDAGGPAQRSGLRQGDAVLQLNGLPVETWTCGELAHAIRSCPSHITVVVWRGSPEVRTCCETLLRPPAAQKTTRLLHQPARTKHGRRRRDGGSVVASGLEVLGSLWGDRKQEEGEAEEASCASSLTGTCVTSSNGDNYILLSPVTPQEQLLQPRFEDTGKTMGRVYQTHSRRGLNLLGGSTGQALIQPPAAFSSTLRNYATYGDYQNCTIIQSHRPSGGFGQAAKTLIFPIFVEPVDLCSPGRTLLMSEQMLLHRARQPPCKVSVLIYDDVLLLSTEDQAGRCHVLMSPLFLRTLRLQEVAPAPRHLFLLQTAGSCWQCLFTLEAFSPEQKVRVGLCLRDNIQRQLLAEEKGHDQQLTASPRAPPDTSAYASARLPSPVWKERGGGEEEEEGRRRLKDLSSASRLQGVRRCASEGSLRARASEMSRSRSDSTVHRLTSDLQASCLPSARTLRKHLTSEGVTLRHTLALLRGAEDVEIENDFKKKTKSFASDVRSRLPFLRRHKRSVQSESLERALRNARPSAREVTMWAESLGALLANRYGLAVFRHFLRSEYSEENLDFWLAVEKFKQTRPLSKMADKTYKEFVSCGASRQVNVDSEVRELTRRGLRVGVEIGSLQRAQDHIFNRMEADSYPRFLRSHLYARLANQDAGPAEHSRATSAQALDRNPTGKLVIM
ncbi:regulator of G-protein signaling 3-like isoform X2 [Vanacampus margaritifer]